MQVLLIPAIASPQGQDTTVLGRKNATHLPVLLRAREFWSGVRSGHTEAAPILHDVNWYKDDPVKKIVFHHPYKPQTQSRNLQS